MIEEEQQTPEEQPAEPEASADESTENSAQSTEPATSAVRLSSSIRRLPTMSPSRPAIGIATAAASRVAVIAQEASAAELSRRCGSTGTSGMIIVWVSATTMPQ